MDVDIRIGEDMGSNLMDAYVDEFGPLNGLMEIVFKGYESKGREAFTLEDIQELLIRLSMHAKFKRYSPIIINILGTMDFNYLNLVKESGKTPLPKSKAKGEIRNNSDKNKRRKANRKKRKRKARKKQ